MMGTSKVTVYKSPRKTVPALSPAPISPARGGFRICLPVTASSWASALACWNAWRGPAAAARPEAETS